MAHLSQLFDRGWKCVLWCLLLGLVTSQVLVLTVVILFNYSWYPKRFEVITPGSNSLPRSHADRGFGYDRIETGNQTSIIIFDGLVAPAEEPGWFRTPTEGLGPTTGWVIHSFAAGWPLRSQTGRVRHSQSANYFGPLHPSGYPTSLLDGLRHLRVSIRGSILYLQVPRHMGGRNGWTYDTPYVPLRPLPVGLAVNTICYAVMWWTFLFGPFALRRALRRRAGKCVKCKYDLTGIDADQPCPECGRGFEPAPRG